MKIQFTLCLLACSALQAQTPPPTQLPEHPFFVKKTWIIGGLGNWDYLTVDPKANQLFIAHGTLVQVVDVTTGAVTGQITGLREAHAIALDDTGEFGYISDGLADEVKVFDRRSLQVVATIPTGPAPRALALDPQSGLLFAICGVPVSASPSTPRAPVKSKGQAANPTPVRTPARSTEIKTSVTVIDIQSRRPLATILMPGRLGFAQSDSNGEVYVNIIDRDSIARLDAQAIGSLLRGETRETPSLDWTLGAHSQMHIFSVGAGCHDPSSLAVDHSHQRLFASCSNMKMSVLNALTGELVTSLPTGPGTDTIVFDPDRGLIYSANGGANGSLTVIRQDVTDTYAVIQILPTQQRARTLAVNPSTGEVYLVTDLQAVNLTQPGGIGTLRTMPADGSFHVLVVAN